MKTHLLILFALWVNGFSLCCAEGLAIATQAADIARALTIPAKPVDIEGVAYTIRDEKIYRAVNGKQKRERKPSPAVRCALEPRVVIPVEFKENSDELAMGAEEIISEIASALNRPEFKRCKFRIACHTDNHGKTGDKTALLRARAESIRHLLIHRYNVNYRGLRVKPYGEPQPVADNATEEGHQLNQRIEIVRELL